MYFCKERVDDGSGPETLELNNQHSPRGAASTHTVNAKDHKNSKVKLRHIYTASLVSYSPAHSRMICRFSGAEPAIYAP